MTFKDRYMCKLQLEDVKNSMENTNFNDNYLELNGRDISSNSKRLIGFYIKGNGTNRGDLTNNATIDFSNSLGSIGIYAPGGKATNKGRVLVGRTDDIDPATGKVYSDVSKIVYGIGMAAEYFRFAPYVLPLLVLGACVG